MELGLLWSITRILYGGILVLSAPQAAQSSHMVNNVMKAISFKAICLPPSLLEDVVKAYGSEFKVNAKNLKFIFYGGGMIASCSYSHISA